MSSLLIPHLSSIYTEEIYYFGEANTVAPEIIKVKEPEKKPVEALIETRKNFLIFHSGAYLEPNEKLLLNKILNSVSLKFEDVELFTDFNEDSLKEVLKINSLIIINFGVKIYHIWDQFNEEKYILQNKNNIKYLLADSLSSIDVDVEKKKLLWKVLKSVFM